MKVYYDSDTDLDLVKKNKDLYCWIWKSGTCSRIKPKKDSGVNDIIIALRKDSKSVEKAKSDGFEVMEVEEAAKVADICMILVPDELQADFTTSTLKKFKKGSALLFAHGLAIHFQLINPRKD